MADRRNIGLRHVLDGVRESRSRNSKLSQKRMKTKRRVVALKDSQSPSYHNSYNCRRDFTTPKRRPKIRYNGCYSGDSPNETESLQDIIWDPNSPTQNITGNGGNVKAIEISEIVKRIAPKVERANEGDSVDSVLQWIGDSAIPCTPEVRQPRFRRISTRQSNVEDLMKLAKQFDINMTRQDKEKQQNITENLNKLSKAQSDGMSRAKLASFPLTSKEVTGCLSQNRKEEEELQALFDGPTQHLSGRLSPPSADGTPEGRTDPVALAGPGSSSAVTGNAPVDAPKATELDFDDDWENDDLLNDSFVLEMTQNPVPLNVVQKQSITLPDSSDRNCNFVTKTNPCVSNGKDICLQIQQSTSKSSILTRTLPEGQASVQNTSRPKPIASAQDKTTEKLIRTSFVDKGKHPVHSSQKQEKLDRATKDCKSSGQTSTFDGGLWNDEEDDDLLCQACDDVERISASQEQQKHSMDFTKPADNSSKASSSTGITYAQNIGINGKNQVEEPTKSMRAFARSNSVPCSSGNSGFKQDYSVFPTTDGLSSILGSVIPYNCTKQNNLTQVKSASGPKPTSVRATDTSHTIIPQSKRVGNASNSHHFTFKRHLSDSVTLTNKVFVSSNTTVKCSAAEIEKKKQEAIARRRLRMQAKHGAPT